MSEVFSIIKHPVVYKDKQYFVTIEEVYDGRDEWNYIDVKIYVLNDRKFKVFKYKKVDDHNRLNFVDWHGKYKELMINSVEAYMSNKEYKTEKVNKKDICRKSGLEKLEQWDKNIK